MCSTSRPGQRCRHRSSLLQAVSQTAFLLYLHHLGQALTTASANLLQAQTAFLLHLHHSGQASDVVFMDTDILVVYALTLSDAVDMPINIGMQVRGGLLAVSIDLLLFWQAFLFVVHSTWQASLGQPACCANNFEHDSHLAVRPGCT